MSDIKIPKKAIYTIAGTVGVGKSTLTKALAKELNYKASFEKVDDNPYLEDYYSDFKKWSFHLQIYFLAERFKQQKEMYEDSYGYIQDRSIYEDVYIFAKLQHDKGNMTDRDYATYTSLFKAMVLSPYFPKPDVLIYIDGSVESILKRIHTRGREMEINTDSQYWIDLKERYDNWILSFNECPVLHLSIDEYECNDPTSIKAITKSIIRLHESSDLSLKI